MRIYHKICLLYVLHRCRMLSRKFAQLRIITRCFTRSSIIREINKDKIPAEKIVNDTTGVIGSRMHRVSDFDRRMLVWVKRYPSIADVPKDVTVECLLHARNKARIKTGNYLIGFTILGCIGAVILGKRDAARGENLVKQREDWLRERFAEDKKK